MKGFWKNSIVGFILKNILAAAVLVAAIGKALLRVTRTRLQTA